MQQKHHHQLAKHSLNLSKALGEFIIQQAFDFAINRFHSFVVFALLLQLKLLVIKYIIMLLNIPQKMSKKQPKVPAPPPAEPEVIEETIEPKRRRKHRKPSYIS